jgi:hypothetical protein
MFVRGTVLINTTLYTLKSVVYTLGDMNVKCFAYTVQFSF